MLRRILPRKRGQTGGPFVCHVREGLDEKKRAEWRKVCKGLTFYGEHEGERYCVLHMPGKDEEAEAQFRYALVIKYLHQDLDFAGVCFPRYLGLWPVEQPLEFEKKASFRGAIFEGKANFFGATFKGDADFTEAIFEEEANFSTTEHPFSAEDTPKELFNETYMGATFNKWANFYGATFNKAANFYGTTFNNRANFLEATFNKAARFSGATFNEEAYFPDTTFNKWATFYKATFKGEANFTRTTFEEANLSEVTFHKKADFLGTTFGKEAVFYRAAFEEKANFTSTSERPEDTGATFKEGARFTSLETFPETMLSFGRATMEKPERIRFHTTYLRPSWFVDVDAQEFDFIDVKWFGMRGNQGTLDEEIIALEERRVESPHTLLAQACRRLSANAEENHEYPLANEFHYWSMDALRKVGWSRLGLISTLYWALSGYGVRAARAFVVLVGICAVFAVFYMLLGPNALRVSSASSIGQALEHAGQAIVYSLSTMARLNPEPKPNPGLFQFLVTIEGILGPLQIALLALAIRRKVMR